MRRCGLELLCLQSAVMRSVFLGLVAANLAYLGWTLWLAPPVTPAGMAAPKLPRIMLGNELPPRPAAAARCVAVGPFLAADEVSRAGRLLEEGGYQPTVRVATGDVATGVATSVRESKRPGNVFWLEFALKSNSAAATPEELQATLGGPEGKLRVTACAPPETASGG